MLLPAGTVLLPAGTVPSQIGISAVWHRRPAVGAKHFPSGPRVDVGTGLSRLPDVEGQKNLQRGI